MPTLPNESCPHDLSIIDAEIPGSVMLELHYGQFRVVTTTIVGVDSPRNR